MTVQSSSRRSGGGYLERPAPSGLADVVETILDKGIVIDAYVRVSLVGIELLTVDARIVIASVDTYLRFAEATNRLDLYEKGGKDLTEAIGDLQETGAAKKVGGAVKGVKKAITGGDDDNEDENEEFGGPLEGVAWILKRGARGCSFDGAARPALEVPEVVDTTGAGDALAAGWILGGPDLALEAAARCVQRVGPMP